MLNHPSGGQIGHRCVIVVQPIDCGGGTRTINQRAMCMHHATRRAGRTRGKKQCRWVLRAAACQLRIQMSRHLRHGIAPLGQQRVIRLHMRLPVMAHPDVIVVNDVADRWALRHRGQQLVHLLLVLGENHADFRALDRACDFCRRGVGKQRHHHTAQPLDGSHRSKQARPVLAEQAHMVATLHTGSRQAGCHQAHLVSQATPGDRLPDAAAFLAHGRPIRARLGVVKKNLRESIHPQLLLWTKSALLPAQQAPHRLCVHASRIQHQNSLSFGVTF